MLDHMFLDVRTHGMLRANTTGLRSLDVAGRGYAWMMDMMFAGWYQLDVECVDGC